MERMGKRHTLIEDKTVEEDRIEGKLTSETYGIYSVIAMPR